MKKKILIIIIVIFVLITCFSIYYVSDYYKAIDVDNYMNNTNEVKVLAIDNGYMFDGPGENTALIFYPGAKIETKAYAKLMNKLATIGIDCFLIDMPCRLAFLGKNTASQILNNYNYSNWYIAGHSLGGVVASQYAADNPEKINALILLASYPTKKINDNIKLLSIFGEKDSVLNRKSYDDSKKYWPVHNYETEIKGGNHANFGDYGEQQGDNVASISNDKQQEKTVIFINDVILHKNNQI